MKISLSITFFKNLNVIEKRVHLLVVHLQLVQDLSVRFEREIRVKRSAFNVGVLVWIEVDVTDCYGDCFSDIDIVANYLGAASAKKVSTCLQRF